MFSLSTEIKHLQYTTTCIIFYNYHKSFNMTQSVVETMVRQLSSECCCVSVLCQQPFWYSKTQQLKHLQIAKAWLGICSKHYVTTVRAAIQSGPPKGNYKTHTQKITFNHLSVIGMIILPCNLPEVCSCCKGFQLCNREDAKKTFSTSEVVVSNCSIVLLPCCIQYINLDFFPIQNHLFPVAICFGGLIVFNKLEKKTLHDVQSCL